MALLVVLQLVLDGKQEGSRAALAHAPSRRLPDVPWSEPEKPVPRPVA